MRSMRSLRKARPMKLLGGVLAMTIPASAVALAAGQANAQSAIQIDVKTHHLALGEDLSVTGTAPDTTAGTQVSLEFAPGAGASWRTIGRTSVGGSGSFSFRQPLRESGLIRVISASAPISHTSGRGAPPPPAGTPAASSSQSVSVASELRAPVRTLNVLAGSKVTLRGVLLPGRRGRRVALRAEVNGSWKTLATAITRSSGAFALHYVPGGTGHMSLRLRFDGDRLNAMTWTRAGRLTVYRESVASWYDDAGQTACGFHATYGVANLSLPCGTKVTFRFGGRTVTATVDDRGPYVGGREWDLNQNTAQALGFSGVQTVWSTD